MYPPGKSIHMWSIVLAFIRLPLALAGSGIAVRVYRLSGAGFSPSCGRFWGGSGAAWRPIRVQLRKGVHGGCQLLFFAVGLAGMGQRCGLPAPQPAGGRAAVPRLRSAAPDFLNWRYLARHYAYSIRVRAAARGLRRHLSWRTGLCSRFLSLGSSR